MLQKFYSKNKNKIEAALTAQYPYTYARISVMKSVLIKKTDYQKLIKMSLNEATSFLESTEYKKEIDESAVNHKGIELVEIALNKNLSNTYRKFRRISPEKLRLVIDIYLKRHDISNIKTLLRAKYTGENEIASLIQPYTLTSDFLKELLKKNSIEEMLKEIKIIDRSVLKKAYERFSETNSLIEIENALDQHYYDEMLDSMNSKKPSLFKEFLQKEIDIRNILNIFRFKREGMDKAETRKYIIGKTQNKLMKKLANSAPEDLPTNIENSKYGKYAKKGIEEYRKRGTLIYLETDLYKHLLTSGLKLLYQRPLKADAIFGYLFAKEIEVRNLKMLVKAKQLGLPQEFIEEQVII